jgi:predicted transcriptional regulator
MKAELLSTKLEKLLALLNDNVWHNIKEVAETLEIPQEKAQKIIEFLTQADMIQHNPTTNQIKLNQNWKTLIINQKETSPTTQTQTTQETATAIGTIIIPPQKTLIIQCTRITNLTDTSLELEIRINKKLNEIAINKIH